jgi:thiol-disulfide isomerase/thioredoxin
MIELYMGIGCPHCEDVEPILEQLVEAYGYDQVILVEEAVSRSEYTTIGTIEKVSSSTLNNLEINGMIFIERKEEELKYSVTDIFDEQKVEITSLAPEESLDFSFTLEGINWEGDNVHGVIFVQTPESSTKEILQAAYVE